MKKATRMVRIAALPTAMLVLSLSSGCHGNESLQNFEASHPGPDVVRSEVGYVSFISCTMHGTEELFTVGIQAQNDQEPRTVYVHGPIAAIPPSGEISWTIRRKNLKQDFWDVQQNHPLQGDTKPQPCPE